MQDIATWLQKIGMSEYAGRFAENRIDISVLPDLTDADLKELGVVLGDRRKMLRAIAELGNDRAAPSVAEAVPQNTGERRQLTVVFCDLVGSTALSGQFDPEDLRQIIGAYHRCCAETIECHGGFVAKYMGDGVLAYFGYPQAHEHDAERAVRAGLALAQAVPKLETVAGQPLAARIGIATGLVVVGDLLGSGEAQERTVVGETPNLAARLQSLAEPGMVVIADNTRKLVGGLFELQDLGAKELKGIAASTRAWAALRASAAESRFDALHAAGALRLIGRETEIDLLKQLWRKAESGAGQVLLLSGEAGIGKSRLAAAIQEIAAAMPHEQLRYFCSPQHAGSALHPFIGQIERAAGLSIEDAPQSRLDKLQALLTKSAVPADQAELFAALLSLPNDGRFPALTLTPQQRRQKTLEALCGQLAVLSKAGPLLMIFEDAHWSDPSSLDLLRLIVDGSAAYRILLLVTSRPEFTPPWPARDHMTVLRLERLTQANASAMVDSVAGAEALSAETRRDIIERTDGIPLFVEEMTKAVLEAGHAGGMRRTAAAVPPTALAVPASLHASLMARLDRLGTAKEIAQIGATIGREFSHALLAAVAQKSDEDLHLALDRLIGAGLLFRRGLPPDIIYMFNHALVQDAAYGTLLREPRRALHHLIADAFERHFPDIAENQPELLARHWSEAGLGAKAAVWWGKAGRRSLARSALREAVDQLSRALDLLGTLPGTATSRREQINLQIDLSNALIHTRGHASAETKASFEKARSLMKAAEVLGEPPEDSLLLFSVLYGFWVGNRMAFKGDVACELATQFHALAQGEKAAAPRMIGHMLMGISLVLVGQLADGKSHLDRVIELYDLSEHRVLATRFGHDVRVTAFCWRALARWMLGHSDSATRDIEQALNDARDMGHAATAMFALCHTGLARVLLGDIAGASALADDVVVMAQEKGSLYWKSYGQLLQGCILAQTGKTSEAAGLLVSASTAMRSTGATAYRPWYMAVLAEVRLALGEFDEARGCIAEALAVTDETGERWYEGEIHRIAGEVALSTPGADLAQVEGHFGRAIALGRTQQAKSFELRAAMSLARLWQRQGNRQQANQLLTSLLGTFTEGASTADMIAARSFLSA